MSGIRLGQREHQGFELEGRRAGERDGEDDEPDGDTAEDQPGDRLAATGLARVGFDLPERDRAEDHGQQPRDEDEAEGNRHDAQDE